MLSGGLRGYRNVRCPFHRNFPYAAWFPHWRTAARHRGAAIETAAAEAAVTSAARAAAPPGPVSEPVAPIPIARHAAQTRRQCAARQLATGSLAPHAHRHSDMRWRVRLLRICRNKVKGPLFTVFTMCCVLLALSTLQTLLSGSRRRPLTGECAPQGS
ncbi:uncharacterized protein LOC119103964 [Pollicipes pollicipes]|uniref:uncharacterized protein LOC119103964 n=1 Tax=Pollicipes pollicipes TaxID=41117 RepID=UPI001885A2F9|nr:uncharacterized protein LOC119103964 [Pollicipes pollicipes]